MVLPPAWRHQRLRLYGSCLSINLLRLSDLSFHTSAPPKIGAILSSIDRPEIKVRVLSVRKAPRRSHYNLRVEVVVATNRPCSPSASNSTRLGPVG